MKKLSWLNKFIFFTNSLFATALLLAYLVPYISPKTIPTIALLSLIVPFLIISNVLFAIYWLIKLKRQFLVSLIVLAIGFTTLNAFFKIDEKKVLLNNDVKIMSYNVRLFNLYKWKKENKEETLKSITNFITKKTPDIVCFQEFLTTYKNKFNYKYKYVNTDGSNFGQAIYTNYKILNSGSLNFDNTANNAIYIDFIKQKDTIRIYNVHLESLKIQLNKENFGEKNSKKLFNRLQINFKKQAAQVEKLIAHEKKSPYKTIICGDFNNTAFSWVYKKLKGNKTDAFVEAGKGFGKSYDYLFPARIDFILANNKFTVNNFKTYKVKYSDHFPIMVRLTID